MVHTAPHRNQSQPHMHSTVRLTVPAQLLINDARIEGRISCSGGNALSIGIESSHTIRNIQAGVGARGRL